MAQQKSGDSLLSDAAKAREDGRKDGGASPSELRNSLPAQLQDSAEQKKAEGDLKGAEVTALLLKDLLRRLDDLETGKHVVSTAREVRGVKNLMQCATCHQLMREPGSKAGVCTGEHVSVFVGPQDPDMWSTFDAVIHNGISYRGPSILPLTIVDAVKAAANRAERMERRKFIPSGKWLGRAGFVGDVASIGEIPII